MPSDRRWSDADREPITQVLATNTLAGELKYRSLARAAIADAVLDALTAAGWVRMDPAEPHLIEFRADGWTIQHPVRCRPNLFACPVNRVAGEQVDEPPEPGLGVYECDVDDGELLIGRRIEEGEADE